MNTITEAGVTIIGLFVGLAIISTLVSPKATTGADIQALASGVGNDIAVAQSPVTGTSFSIDLSYPTSSGYSGGFGG
jgi:hypothetical protein